MVTAGSPTDATSGLRYQHNAARMGSARRCCHGGSWRSQHRHHLSHRDLRLERRPEDDPGLPAHHTAAHQLPDARMDRGQRDDRRCGRRRGVRPRRDGYRQVYNPLTPTTHLGEGHSSPSPRTRWLADVTIIMCCRRRPPPPLPGAYR